MDFGKGSLEAPNWAGPFLEAASVCYRQSARSRPRRIRALVALVRQRGDHMSGVIRILTGSVAAMMTLVLVGCGSFERVELAERAKSELVGFSKEEILACMGAPSERASAGETEVWDYDSGVETVATTTGSATATNRRFFGSQITSFHRLYCEVSVVIEQDRVTGINYRGNTGGLFSEGEQCSYVVENCLQPTPVP